jgi:hypothetical protein
MERQGDRRSREGGKEGRREGGEGREGRRHTWVAQNGAISKVALFALTLMLLLGHTQRDGIDGWWAHGPTNLVVACPAVVNCQNGRKKVNAELALTFSRHEISDK